MSNEKEPIYNRTWMLVDHYMSDTDRSNSIDTFMGVICSGRSHRDFGDTLEKDYRDAIVVLPDRLLCIRTKPKLNTLKLIWSAKTGGEDALVRASCDSFSIPRNAVTQMTVNASLGMAWRMMGGDYLHVESSAMPKLTMWLDIKHSDPDHVRQICGKYQANSA